MKDRLVSGLRDYTDRTLKAVVRDEAVRKRMVAGFYRAKQNGANLARRPVGEEAETLLDCEATLQRRFMTPREIYRGNTFYGLGQVLRQYANAREPIRACIEHGVYFGDYTNPFETTASGLPAIVTMSDVRRTHIRAVSDIPILTVGPYIGYAESMLADADRARLKQQLGSTLLAFPSHGLDRVDVKYDQTEFIAAMKSLQRELDIDSVIVCLYFRDVMRGHHLRYRSAGFHTATAGRREDPSFLRRLRGLIELSDFSVSNAVGTHVGYCVQLGTPHFVFSQDSQYVGHARRDVAEHQSVHATSSTLEKAEVSSAFSEPQAEISASQRQVCDKYWGLSNVRTPEELRSSFGVLLDASRDGRPYPFADIEGSLLDAGAP